MHTAWQDLDVPASAAPGCSCRTSLPPSSGRPSSGTSICRQCSVVLSSCCANVRGLFCRNVLIPFLSLQKESRKKGTAAGAFRKLQSSCQGWVCQERHCWGCGMCMFILLDLFLRRAQRQPRNRCQRSRIPRRQSSHVIWENIPDPPLLPFPHPKTRRCFTKGAQEANNADQSGPGGATVGDHPWGGWLWRLRHVPKGGPHSGETPHPLPGPASEIGTGGSGVGGTWLWGWHPFPEAVLQGWSQQD